MRVNNSEPRSEMQFLTKLFLETYVIVVCATIFSFPDHKKNIKEESHSRIIKEHEMHSRLECISCSFAWMSRTAEKVPGKPTRVNKRPYIRKHTQPFWSNLGSE